MTPTVSRDRVILELTEALDKLKKADLLLSRGEGWLGLGRDEMVLAETKIERLLRDLKEAI